MTPCPRSRRRAAAASSSWDQTPSLRGDPWPARGSGSQRDPAHPPDPAGNTPGDQAIATHVARAAARWSDPAARGGTTWASAYPILPPRSIAVTAFWADSGASVECCSRVYARQPPSPMFSLMQSNTIITSITLFMNTSLNICPTPFD